MAHIGLSSFTAPCRLSAPWAGAEAGPTTVVWLDGELDISNDRALCLTLARAIALDDAGLVIDLSGVELIGVATIEVIVRAREFLRQRSRSLTVRFPSACARSVIEACGFEDLLGQATAPRTLAPTPWGRRVVGETRLVGTTGEEAAGANVR